MVAARTAEPVTAAADERPGRSARPSGRALALLALGLVGLLAVVAVAATVPTLSAASDREERRSAVLAAARQAAVNFTTLDYRRLDRDLGRVRDGATGKFRRQFAAGTADLSTLVTQNKAVSRGEVLDAGIVSDDRDSARVLVVADSTVTNAAESAPQKRHYRLQLDLVRRDGRWLVSDLQFVG